MIGVKSKNGVTVQCYMIWYDSSTIPDLELKFDFVEQMTKTIKKKLSRANQIVKHQHDVT